ncbi:MAG: hypothetical protein H6753_00940 [Candidatus Omnitrophica bacterium]|jgi:hypothetical protein|nr:hypothetical protein [Candidatus Omnitrophota bacterium]
MQPKSSSTFGKILRFILGLSVMIAGITLVLLWWNDVMVVFRGFIGVLLALGGLLILYLLQK